MAVPRKIQRAGGTHAILISNAFEEFISQKEAQGSAASTLRNYKQSFEYFMEFNDFDDSTPITEIEQALFFKWMNSMRIEGIAPTSINHYLRDVRAFFYWCMDEGREYVKPRFKIEMIKGQEESIKFFDDEDIAALLRKPSIKKDVDNFAEWRTWAIVNWVLGTGNRASTIVNVRIGDISYKDKEITLTHTKNRKAQIIPLSPALEIAIKEYIRLYRANCKWNDWLFPSIQDIKLTTDALRHSFTKYCHDRGVNQTNIHGLRHTFARDYIRNNGTPFTLQKILGHSTLEMTKRYVALVAADLKKDFEKVSPLDNIRKSAKRAVKLRRLLEE